MEQPKKLAHLSKHWLTYLLLVLLIGTSSGLWLNNKRVLRNQAEAFSNQQITERELAQQTLDSLNTGQLQATMKALVWAVRSELVRDNVEQVDQYFRQFVKMDGVDEITLIDNQGTIRLSTNMKDEGDLLDPSLAEQAMQATDVQFIEFEQQAYLYIVAPVMSYNNRLGTLVLYYDRPQITYTDNEPAN